MYVKLFSSILTSSVWSEDNATRIVWITMLALADKDGDVRSSPSGLARLANVSIEECQKALAKFQAPDPEDPTQENEGRRIEERDGGWFIFKYQHYRALQDQETRKAQWRESSKKHRQQQSAKRQHRVSTNQHGSAHTDTESDTESEASSSSSSSPSTSAVMQVIASMPTDAVRAAWKAEMNAAMQGAHGPALTGAQVEQACRDYIGNNHLEDKPSLRHFRSFLRNAGRPPRPGATGKISAGRHHLTAWMEQP